MFIQIYINFIHIIIYFYNYYIFNDYINLLITNIKLAKILNIIIFNFIYSIINKIINKFINFCNIANIKINNFDRIIKFTRFYNK